MKIIGNWANRAQYTVSGFRGLPSVRPKPGDRLPLLSSVLKNKINVF
jgi:hypothetical protein